MMIMVVIVVVRVIVIVVVLVVLVIVVIIIDVALECLQTMIVARGTNLEFWLYDKCW